MDQDGTEPMQQRTKALEPAPKKTRRKFLKTMIAMGATVGAASYWTATSQRRSARWLRQMVADARRPIAPAYTDH